MLFNIAGENIIRRARSETGGTIFTKAVQWHDFADDIDVIAQNCGTVNETYTRQKLISLAYEYVQNQVHDRKCLQRLLDGRRTSFVEVKGDDM